ncbi:MAG: type I 3-dehydroquinate dehydratase [Proteobacteria bacterium]|nr:type I 3-dehydroquinate dehydratase [Pseudomonadota bacterium]MBU1743161.1 type I 3-dehydroquinate dehydratase [Pseudomonadota bacterium]
MKSEARICASVIEPTPDEARRVMAGAGPWADLFEWRLDFLSSTNVPPTIDDFPHPLILACRPQWDGGGFRGDEEARAAFLGKFLALAPDYVDVELEAGEALWDAIRGRPANTRLIVSLHLWEATPPEAFLIARFKQLARAEADVIKLVTRAQRVEDNLRVLSLIPWAKDLGLELIAFCLGPMGRWSRVAAPLMGVPWTYAPARAGAASAPGQIEGPLLRRMLEALT